LTFGIRRRDPFLLLTGDLGVGKTTVCRTLLHSTRQHRAAMYVASPLRSGVEFERNVLDAFSVRAVGDLPDGAVIIVDEAHTTPLAVIEVLRSLTSAAAGRGHALSVVFAAQPAENDVSTKSIRAVDHMMSTRARLMPFSADDCAEYIAHRLAHAGGAGISFSPRAIEALFVLSGGVPRLVNLLCERALREAAAVQSSRIEPLFIDMAASALELLRPRPKRFRWFERTSAVVSSVG
jgi:general secretion pathway protein A